MGVDLKDLKARLKKHGWKLDKEDGFPGIYDSEGELVVSGDITEELVAWLDGYEYGKKQRFL